MEKINNIKNNNIVLNKIIQTRRSIRNFKPDLPPKKSIEKIIEAGKLAPYPGWRIYKRDSVDNDYRRFIIISRKNPIIKQIAKIVKRVMKDRLIQYERQMMEDSLLKEYGNAHFQRLKHIAKYGFEVIGKAPYYIVIGERIGSPAMQDKSLSHCLQNMWLMATALGLGFQLLSSTTRLGEDKQFCKLLSIPHGKFRLDGCLVGYADTNTQLEKSSQIIQKTVWIE